MDTDNYPDCTDLICFIESEEFKKMNLSIHLKIYDYQKIIFFLKI